MSFGESLVSGLRRHLAPITGPPIPDAPWLERSLSRSPAVVAYQARTDDIHRNLRFGACNFLVGSRGPTDDKASQRFAIVTGASFCRWSGGSGDQSQLASALDWGPRAGTNDPHLFHLSLRSRSTAMLAGLQAASIAVEREQRTF
jgi:hypothetical protein